MPSWFTYGLAIKRYLAQLLDEWLMVNRQVSMVNGESIEALNWVYATLSRLQFAETGNFALPESGGPLAQLAEQLTLNQ